MIDIGFDFENQNTGAKKEIRFTLNGKTNYNQKKYINALFDKVDGKIILKSDYDELAYFGAFRCAKSNSQQLAGYILPLIFPGSRGLFVRDTFDQLDATVIKQYLEEFESLGTFTYLPSGTPKRCASFKNGSTVLFRSFEKDTDILSAEYDWIACCQAEDLPYELLLQLLGRSSGRRLGRGKGLILTEGNPASGWVRDRYQQPSKEELKKKRIFAITDGATSDNPWITKEYISSLEQNYPKFWLDRYLYGLWDNREELIFSEFNEKEHVIEPIDPNTIPSDYIRRNALDWGWVNPSAALFSFVDYDGNLVIYDEFYRNQTLPENVAKELLRYGSILTVADHAMKGLKMPTQDDANKTVWTELERNKVKLTECNKEELSNIVFTNMRFKQGKILITKNCVNLLREVKNWKWKRLKLGADKNMLEEPIDKDNHTCDGLNYLVADLFRDKSKDSKKDKSFKESFYKAVITRSDEMKVTQMS
jgi:phage terminase large subunit